MGENYIHQKFCDGRRGKRVAFISRLCSRRMPSHLFLLISWCCLPNGVLFGVFSGEICCPLFENVFWGRPLLSAALAPGSVSMASLGGTPGIWLCVFVIYEASWSIGFRTGPTCLVSAVCLFWLSRLTLTYYLFYYIRAERQDPGSGSAPPAMCQVGWTIAPR